MGIVRVQKCRYSVLVVKAKVWFCEYSRNVFSWYNEWGTVNVFSIFLLAALVFSIPINISPFSDTLFEICSRHKDLDFVVHLLFHQTRGIRADRIDITLDIGYEGMATGGNIVWNYVCVTT